MRLIWDITAADVSKVTEFLEGMKDNAFVVNRIATNVTGAKPAFSKDRFWHEMIACLLTTQQKSGPGSAISRFIETDPFPLSVATCAASTDLESLVRDVLTRAGGIRGSNKVATESSRNLRLLDDGLWAEVESVWGRLAAAKDDPVMERQAARAIDQALWGFGPKQARNLIQSLGLTKYEVPLDSRFVKWLRAFGFPVDISGQSLSDTGVYEFVLDGIQALCRECKVYPCVLDAAVFASFDGDGWNRA